MIKTGANNLAAYLQMKFKTSKNMRKIAKNGNSIIKDLPLSL